MRCLRAILLRPGGTDAAAILQAGMAFAIATAMTVAMAIVMAIACGTDAARAGEPADNDFAKRFFAGNVGKPKAYACFVRRYDAAHMAEHPKQKVTVLKILITSELLEDDKYLNYSFRLGVNFRDRPGDFDSSGDCGHAPTVRNPDTDARPAAGIDFNCGVDCDGGGIAVNLANSDNSLIVKLDRMRIWKSTDPDGAPDRFMEGGAEDKVFRLDRVSVDECRPLVTDRKELAAMRTKKR